jgi:hypothetical protein
MEQQHKIAKQKAESTRLSIISMQKKYELEVRQQNKF